jgi:hypothetical protein
MLTPGLLMWLRDEFLKLKTTFSGIFADLKEHAELLVALNTHAVFKNVTALQEMTGVLKISPGTSTPYGLIINSTWPSQDYSGLRFNHNNVSKAIIRSRHDGAIECIKGDDSAFTTIVCGPLVAVGQMTSASVVTTGNCTVAGAVITQPAPWDDKYTNGLHMQNNWGTAIIRTYHNPGVSQEIQFAFQDGTSNGYSKFRWDGHNYARLSWSLWSDIRTKEDITLLDASVDKIKAIPGKRFTRTFDEKRIPQAGFVAQDVQAVFPEAVTIYEPATEEGEEAQLAIDPNAILALAVEALRELIVRVEELEKAKKDDDKAPASPA